MDFVVVPALLQIQLQDPDNNMEPIWIDVPFSMPEAPPIIQLETRVQPKKRDWIPPRKN